MSNPAQPAADKATPRECVHGNPRSWCDFCLSPVDDVARVLRESSHANLSADTCTLLARRIVAECLKPRLTNNTRAQSAAVEGAVKALKACDEYFTEYLSQVPDYILRQQLRKKADGLTRAALAAVEQLRKGDS